MFLLLATGALNEAGDQSVSLWTILLILAIVALFVFIFRNVRR